MLLAGASDMDEETLQCSSWHIDFPNWQPVVLYQTGLVRKELLNFFMNNKNPQLARPDIYANLSYLNPFPPLLALSPVSLQLR